MKVARPVVKRTLEKLQTWARRLKRDAVTLWFACRHPATPWPVKLLCAFVVAYALSPIDLIPDFIPVLGYLDDLLLLPSLVWLAVRMLPATALEQSRRRADAWIEAEGRRPRSYLGAALVVMVWTAIALAGYWYWKR
jgi:uncharacterized membrane protein YkvA (DUF1232 family)